ncbi:MAG: cell division protein ZapA [Clostridia bacterium]|nr:cell division protein ZapA [Clostridia bacterium]
MAVTKTVVSIGGVEYTLCGDEDAEYIHRVALKVNSKVDEMKEQHPDLTNVQLAMLTAINLADDYIKLYDEYEAARRELESLRSMQPTKSAQRQTKK